MTFTAALSDKEIGVDPVAALFRVSALMTDHVTRTRQQYVNHDVDLGQDVKGRVVAVDYRTITIKSANGERRTVPLTAKRAALLSQPPPKGAGRGDAATVSAPSSSSSSSRRASPRKQPKTSASAPSASGASAGRRGAGTHPSPPSIHADATKR